MNKELTAELALWGSSVFFAMAAMLVKVASHEMDGMAISAFRFLIGSVVGLLYLKIAGVPFIITQKKLWCTRGVLGALTMALYYVAIQFIGIGRATLLNHTFVIFVAIFGYLFYQQRIGAGKLLSILLCLIGVGFMFYERGSVSSLWGNLLGLSVGILRGMNIHVIKQSAENEHPVIVYLAACFFGLVLLPFSVGQVRNISVQAMMIVALIGILAFLAQVLMTYGYKYSTAVKGSLISYMGIPLTVFLGYLLGEKLHGKFVIGMILIMGSLVMNSALADHLFRRVFTTELMLYFSPQRHKDHKEQH